MTTTATLPATPQAIEHLPIDAVLPYARNSRTHSDAQVAAVVASMREFGFTNPVLIREDGTIIAGHGRVMAARQIGLATVPCIRLSHLTDAQARAYVIADNKLADLAGWDSDALEMELRELQEGGFDVGLTGFSDDDLRRLLGAADAVPLPTLSNAPRSNLRQMAFILDAAQADVIADALQRAKKMGEFGDTGNENSNGNALARICGLFMQGAANGHS